MDKIKKNLNVIGLGLAFAGLVALRIWPQTKIAGLVLIVLGAACLWWGAAFLWLVRAPERHSHRLALLCGVPVLVPAFLALGRLELANIGPVRGPQIVLWLVLLVRAVAPARLRAARLPAQNQSLHRSTRCTVRGRPRKVPMTATGSSAPGTAGRPSPD